MSFLVGFCCHLCVFFVPPVLDTTSVSFCLLVSHLSYSPFSFAILSSLPLWCVFSYTWKSGNKCKVSLSNTFFFFLPLHQQVFLYSSWFPFDSLFKLVALLCPMFLMFLPVSSSGFWDSSLCIFLPSIWTCSTVEVQYHVFLNEELR